jgi:hypothetical protein
MPKTPSKRRLSIRPLAMAAAPGDAEKKEATPGVRIGLAAEMPDCLEEEPAWLWKRGANESKDVGKVERQERRSLMRRLTMATNSDEAYASRLAVRKLVSQLAQLPTPELRRQAAVELSAKVPLAL